MARYYVSNVRGDDATGTGSATAPWKTINKAIGSSPAITLSGGDTLYIEPGIYREAVTLGLSPTSVNTLAIVGDSDGAGFLAGGYATPATGLVDWRAYSDDATVLTATTLAASGKSYVTLRNVKMLGGANFAAACLSIQGAWSDWTIVDCILVGYPARASVSIANTNVGAAWNLTVDRCDFVASSRDSLVLNSQKHTAEYGMNALVRNCRFFGRNAGVNLAAAGTGSFLATGLTVQNCSFFNCQYAVTVYTATAVNLATPIGVYGCLVVGGAVGLAAQNTTQVVEDGNILLAETPRSNVTAGPNSSTTAASAVNFGDERLTGLPPRPFGEPSTTGPIVAWGSYGTPPSVDLYDQARPSTPSCGALEIDEFPTGGPFGGSSLSCY